VLWTALGVIFGLFADRAARKPADRQAVSSTPG